MDIDYQKIYNTVKIGDKEKLNYNGYYEVPKYMDNTDITIIGFTKTKVKIDNGIEIFNIRYDQIQRVAQEIRKQEKIILKSL